MDYLDLIDIKWRIEYGEYPMKEERQWIFMRN